MYHLTTNLTDTKYSSMIKGLINPEIELLLNDNGKNILRLTTTSKITSEYFTFIFNKGVDDINVPLNFINEKYKEIITEFWIFSNKHHNDEPDIEIECVDNYIMIYFETNDIDLLLDKVFRFVFNKNE